jgi:hypothetical protein
MMPPDPTRIVDVPHRDAGHVVMFGDPVARVTEGFGMLCEIEALAEGLARCFTEYYRSEVEN